MVDEFQDTDPLQAEILWLLSGEGDANLPWKERSIRSGALFLVGDPKQAIYRFRGADVQTYLVAKQALASHDAAAILDISANFRSQESILDFVNDRFTAMLDVSQGQPGFAALSKVRVDCEEPSVATFKITIGDEHRNAKGGLVVDLIRREEAAVVADLVSRLIGNFPVWSKESEAFRPARASDIGLLAPTGTSLWIYEHALESCGIPIATQAGKGFFRRQEVQDLIALVRTIADTRDTLALGALLRGPLVGLTEEEIADAIDSVQTITQSARTLTLWTDLALVENPVLKQTLVILQNLARKARRNNPYQLLAEGIEELHVRSLLKARHPRGAERALANVELVLEMARAYAARGVADFAGALNKRWEDGDAQVEGRPDAEAQAVSIVTIHSAKGLEWPIVIPINSTTSLRSEANFLYRRSDDSVHFKVFDFPSVAFENVKQHESDELRRERVRLWYVALTRTRDLLLLPNQNERLEKDWLSLVDLNLAALPAFDVTRFNAVSQESVDGSINRQDVTTWEREATSIFFAQRKIVWRQPSRHEGEDTPADFSGDIFVAMDGSSEPHMSEADQTMIQGGHERGLILHKLLEEVLTGETIEELIALKTRAMSLISQLGHTAVDDPAIGLSGIEIAETIQRTLTLPEIASVRSRLIPEFKAYASIQADQKMTLTAGICDAVVMNDTGQIETVIDWKSDVDPSGRQIDLYRSQVRDYLRATGAQLGLIVFLTSGRVEQVLPAL